MTKFSKPWVVGLALVGFATAAIARAVWLHRAGYCFPVGRFLADREKIEIAAYRVLGSIQSELWIYPQADGGGNPVGARMERFSSTAEFLAARPDCCRIGAAGPPDMLPVTAGQPRTTTVVVNVLVWLAGQDAQERPSTAQTVVAVNACGEVHEIPRLRRIAIALWRPANG